MAAPAEGKFLVTGTGRSGTLFVTNSLKYMGIRTGHESVYGTRGYKNRWSRYDGDSSWMALPAIDMGAPRPGRIVHVVRDPRKAIASRYEIGIASTMDSYLLNKWECIPPFPGDDVFPSVRLAWMCTLWSALIDVAERISDATFRLEDLPTPSVAGVFMHAIGWPQVDPSPLWTTRRDINHSESWRGRTPANWRAPEGGFSWDDLPAEVRERAELLGYEQ